MCIIACECTHYAEEKPERLFDWFDLIQCTNRIVSCDVSALAHRALHVKSDSAISSGHNKY